MAEEANAKLQSRSEDTAKATSKQQVESLANSLLANSDATVKTNNVANNQLSECEQLYRRLTDKRVYLEAIKLDHNPSAWVSQFKYWTRNLYPNGLRALRRLILAQTMQHCDTVLYASNPTLKPIPTSMQLYRNIPQTIYLDHNDCIPPNVEVRAGDCVSHAIELCKGGKYQKIAMLNMASAFQPGGGYKSGAGAQEENLHRRSNLHQFLEYEQESTHSYPLPRDAVLYSQNVTFFRGEEAHGYPWLSENYTIAVISAAAVRRPRLRKVWNNETRTSTAYLDAEAEEMTRNKIHTILHVANNNKIDCLVLSALGCGAYKNPAHHMAQLFREEINRFYNSNPECSMKLIRFAIFDDHLSARNGQSNIGEFQKAFGSAAASYNTC